MKKQSYWRYWGKADPNYPGEPKWHPLVYHSLDVAVCGDVLLERQPAWLESLCHLSGLSMEALRPWLVFMLTIHDLGKFADGFQQQRCDLQKELQGRETNVGGGERHDTLGYVLGTEYMLDWLGQDSRDKDVLDLLQPWLAAVTGHHGRPPKNDGSAALILRNHFPAPVVADAKQFVIDIAGFLLPEGIPLPSPDYGLEERYQQASWLLAGLAVTADWLGSNTFWFRYREPVYSLAEYLHDTALPQARKAVEESGLVPATASSFTGIRALFPKIREATPLQTWAEAKTTPIAPEPQIFVLEELTGGGKTEAALTLAARLMKAAQRARYLQAWDGGETFGVQPPPQSSPLPGGGSFYSDLLGFITISKEKTHDHFSATTPAHQLPARLPQPRRFEPAQDRCHGRGAETQDLVPKPEAGLACFGGIQGNGIRTNRYPLQGTWPPNPGRFAERYPLGRLAETECTESRASQQNFRKRRPRMGLDDCGGICGQEGEGF